MPIEERLKSLGVSLPRPSAPAANYLPFVLWNRQLYISGQLPMGENGLEYTGKLGEELDVSQGRAAAKLCALHILAQARAALQDLEKIGRLLKLTGFVNAAAGFTDHPKVINGASDFMAEALGEKGQHARSAIGVASLPFGAAVEIEAVFATE